MVGCIITLLLSGTTAYYLRDRQVVFGEDKNINQYIQELKASKLISDVQSEKYCSYTHQKYSKGSLGCSIDYTFHSSDSDLITASFDRVATEFGWTFLFDNTDGNNEYSEKRYILSRVYIDQDRRCGLHIYQEEQKYKYEIGCSGPAKAEWFPVRED